LPVLVEAPNTISIVSFTTVVDVIDGALGALA